MKLKSKLLVFFVLLSGCVGVKQVSIDTVSLPEGKVYFVSAHPTPWPWDTAQLALLDCQKKPCQIVSQQGSGAGPMGAIQSLGITPTWSMIPAGY